jgi:hypothetical protein
MKVALPVMALVTGESRARRGWSHSPCPMVASAAKQVITGNY